MVHSHAVLWFHLEKRASILALVSLDIKHMLYFTPRRNVAFVFHHMMMALSFESFLVATTSIALASIDG
jgi:hypothetical protein